MVVVPAGEFLMGAPASEQSSDDDERPRHEVTFARPFAVGRFAVTFAEWDACVAEGGCKRYRPGDRGWGRGMRPVINLWWEDARAYVAWLSDKTGRSYRLLSEAEREYVARAGTTTPFWWGDTISSEQANYERRLQVWLPAQGRIRAANTGGRPCRSIRSRQIRGASIRCTATSTSGSRIAGTATTRARRRTARPGPRAIAPARHAWRIVAIRAVASAIRGSRCRGDRGRFSTRGHASRQIVGRPRGRNTTKYAKHSNWGQATSSGGVKDLRHPTHSLSSLMDEEIMASRGNICFAAEFLRCGSRERESPRPTRQRPPFMSCRLSGKQNRSKVMSRTSLSPFQTWPFQPGSRLGVVAASSQVLAGGRGRRHGVRDSFGKSLHADGNCAGLLAPDCATAARSSPPGR